MRETMTEIPIPSITTGGSGLGSYVLFLTVVGRKTSKPIHAVRNRGFCVPGVKTSQNLSFFFRGSTSREDETKGRTLVYGASQKERWADQFKNRLLRLELSFYGIGLERDTYIIRYFISGSQTKALSFNDLALGVSLFFEVMVRFLGATKPVKGDATSVTASTVQRLVSFSYFFSFKALTAQHLDYTDRYLQIFLLCNKKQYIIIHMKPLIRYRLGQKNSYNNNKQYAKSDLG